MIDIKQMICMSERELINFIKKFLTDYQVPFKYTEDYIVTTQYSDKIVPLICTHTDTVFPGPVNTSFIDNELGLLKAYNARCLGADDRAGVWIALSMIEEETVTDFEYGFFTAEERGGQGSTAFILDNDLSKYSCFIGLDRASRGGKQNVAVYGYDNDELTKIFTDLGYSESFGTFTDCSNLSSETFSDKRACVNLSVGYDHEHSAKETLDLFLMQQTLNTMLEVEIPEKIFDFVYLPKVWGGYYGGGWNSRRVLLDNYGIGYEGDYEIEGDWDDKGIRQKGYSDYYETGDAILCEFCESHEPLYEFNGSMICKGCLELVRK